MRAKQTGRLAPVNATIPSGKREPTAAHPAATTSSGVPQSSEGAGPPSDSLMHRTPDKLPDPWLFDSEKLLRELDRCREMVLLIPASTHETHFAVNNAISAIWNLREQLRYLLSLHREGQRDFAKQQDAARRKITRAAAKSSKSNIVRLKA